MIQTIRTRFRLARKILQLFLVTMPLLIPACKNAFFPEYPLQVSENSRYLVDHRNRPYFIQSDTPWSLFVALTKTEAENYLENRRQKGFNAITVNLIEHWFKGDSTAYPYASINMEGNAPFSAYLDGNIPDFSKPNEAYFEHSDFVIRKALEKGIVVMMAPAYQGYLGGREGWYAEIIANGSDRCRAYGRYLGKRYKGFSNIIWIMDGDRNPDSLSRPLERDIVKGIRESDTTHLFTAHCHPTFSSRDQWEGEYWLGLNAVYTYNWEGYVHEKCLDNYKRTPVMPVFLFETAYEGEHKYTPTQIRAEMYWGWLCSIGGQQMGNNPVWKFAAGWQAAMDGQGSMDAARLKKLVDSRPWYTLEPDAGHHVVTAGYGLAENYIAAARTTDGKTVIAYIPAEAGPFLVNMKQVSGKESKVWWFDPRSGESTLAGTYPAEGELTFQKPDTFDWVFVMDDISARFSAPGE